MKEWTKPYLAGQTAYVDEEWAAMVEAMEESLRLYLKSVQPPEKNHHYDMIARWKESIYNCYREEDDCRLQCDKPFDQKWSVPHI